MLIVLEIAPDMKGCAAASFDMTFDGQERVPLRRRRCAIEHGVSALVSDAGALDVMARRRDCWRRDLGTRKTKRCQQRIKFRVLKGSAGILSSVRNSRASDPFVKRI